MRRLPLLVLLLLAALPHAAGQVPGAPCGPVTMDAPTSPATPVPAGREAEVAVAVTNGGARAVEVTVGLAATDGGEGWTLPAPEATQAIAAGETATFAFAVVPSDSASEQVTLTFTVANATCAVAAGVPCPPQTCQAALPQSQSAVVRLERPQGVGIPGLDQLGLPLEYLVAGVVLVGVATAIPFLLRKKGGGFAADCPEPLKMVRPGRGTSFPIELRNGGADPLTAQFEIGPVPEGWTAFMPLPEVQLAGRETRSLWLMVRSPPNAADGEAADVELRLRGAGKPGPGSVVRVRAEVNSAASETQGRGA